MRVFAVAHDFSELSADGAVGRCFLAELVGHPVGNGRVIGGGPCKGLEGELLAQFDRRLAAVLVQFCNDLIIIGRIGHDRDIGVVLGGRAGHGRAANVDILDAGGVIRTLGDDILERIEVAAEQVDSGDAVVGHGLLVVGVIADREQAAMNGRMQGFHPAIHDFRKAGDFGNIEHGKAGFLQRLVGASGGDQFHATIRKRLREIDQSCLVENGKKRALDGNERRNGDAFGNNGHRFAS